MEEIAMSFFTKPRPDALSPEDRAEVERRLAAGQATICPPQAFTPNLPAPQYIKADIARALYRRRKEVELEAARLQMGLFSDGLQFQSAKRLLDI
jgi:hypothetical protein